MIDSERQYQCLTEQYHGLFEGIIQQYAVSFSPIYYNLIYSIYTLGLTFISEKKRYKGIF